MSDLEIKVDVNPNGSRILTLSGPLILANLFDFQTIVRQAHTDLIVDLVGVPYMDSAGLGSILGAFASCQRAGCRFALANVSPRVLVTFQVAKVDGMVPMYSSLEAAQTRSAGA
ncbi:MAG: STAS domain-containing protein [Acidobacteriia bacterium]|nr:STAS domain-containing protein [Terriglobia bacterium]